MFKKKGMQIKVLETAIAGMNFHVEGEQDEQNLDELIPGTELKLYKDAENEFDEWAVGVYYGEIDNHIKMKYHIYIKVNCWRWL